MDMEKVTEKVTPHQLQISVSSDRMMAFLKVLSIDNPDPLEPETILNKLKESKISYGIKNEEIIRFCKNGKYFLKLKVAEGVIPINGEDGKVDFEFNTDPNGIPKVKEDGTVDFKNLGLIQNVEKDQLLCTIIPAKKGIEGIDVYGQSVKAKDGITPQIKCGKNTYASEDQLKIFSNTSGNVRYLRSMVEVEDVLRIKGDVGLTTGNIDFDGTVEIQGNVLEGFNVTAKKDIIVKGLVEGCCLTSGQNIVISDGFNGMKKGIIRAEGSVTCKFIETGTVICGDNFSCNVAINSKIKAGNSIKLVGDKAALIGGNYSAGELISAKTVGSDKNILVNLSISLDDNSREEKIKEELEEVVSEMELLYKKVEQIKKFKNISESISQKTAMIQKIITRNEVLTLKKKTLEQDLEKIKETRKDLNPEIICSGQIYRGVKISMGSVSMKISSTISHQRFYLDNGEIVMGMILPTQD
ncbi:DUF342 domain-containing protein [Anaerovorax odorimutans]|uniref:DUF342 domain-containing protein n=1 Tax=Anaerovorax odorimutans TaxID=109327 RepID=UPI00041A303A|nr:FapA family protein [Anaerovorax odorimutans]